MTAKFLRRTFGIRLNQIAAADTVAREWLRKAPEFRDQFRHPAFLKELTRISLFKRDFAEAQTFAMQLTAQIPANDPCVNVLFARAFDSSGSRAAAAVEWRAVLRKDPGNQEAQRALQAPHAAAGD